MQTRDGRNDAMFFVGDQRHRIRRGKTTKKGRNIVKTVRAVKYKGHRLGYLPEAYKGAKDLSLAPFFFD